MQNQSQMKESKEASKSTAIDPLVLTAGASVLLAWAAFYGKGDKEQGLFIGLWPPTLLAFASYFRLNKIEEKLEQQGASGIVRRVQQAIEQQQ
ncbi:hypothetical protein [Natronomonas salina]|uniref:hypothetical protein n=1 Tax=Natronomonas salina TaxID=1710540 RepID=UPI001FE9DB7D|nr:hypothetical protein [Natronomonas salina]